MQNFTLCKLIINLGGGGYVWLWGLSDWPGTSKSNLYSVKVRMASQMGSRAVYPLQGFSVYCTKLSSSLSIAPVTALLVMEPWCACGVAPGSSNIR